MLIYAGSYWLRVRVSRCKVQGLVRGGRWLAGRLSDSNGRSSNLQQRLRCFQRVAQLGTTQQQQQRSRFLVSRFAARAVRASSPYRSVEERHQQHRSYRPAPAHALYGCRSLAALLPCRATAAPSLYLTSLPCAALPPCLSPSARESACLPLACYHYTTVLSTST
jgi:hypothetical protein